jgi:HAD superfamily hydrolase (TIGR01509 family)
MIKQFLFDCGGVLVELNFRELMVEISGSQEIAEYFIRHIWQPGSPWLRYDKGELSCEEVTAQLKEFLPPEYHTYLEPFVKRWLDALPPMEGMEEIVDALREKGYPCYLLSNFAKRFREMPDRTPVLKKLDGMVISSAIHMLKPDPAIYVETAKILGFNLEDTLFVDDSLPNVVGARKAGMQGYLFTTPAEFKAYLRQLDLWLE